MPGPVQGTGQHPLTSQLVTAGGLIRALVSPTTITAPLPSRIISQPTPIAGASPTLVASYFVNSSGQTAAAISTPSFTPTNGEVIVITMETWDTGTSLGSLTGGGQTYTSQVVVAPGGFRPWVGISTAVIAGSPGSMTISATPSASARFSMSVERWSGAQLAASPAVGSGNGGSGAANGSLTTAAANSIVSWVAGDAQSADPSTRAYLSSATDDGVRDDHVGSNGVGYHGYQSAASAGSQIFGLSAPTGQQWCIAGIEVQAAAGGPPIDTIDATLAGTGTLTAGATQEEIATAATLAGTGTLTAAVVQTEITAVSLAGSGTLTAAATRTQLATAVMIAGIGTLTSAVVQTEIAAATLTGTGTLTADATTGAAPVLITASLTGTGTLTAGAVRTELAAATLAGTATLTATVTVARATSTTLAGTGTLLAGILLTARAAATLAGTGALAAGADAQPAFTPALVGLDGSTTWAGNVGAATTTTGNLGGPTTGASTDGTTTMAGSM